jgi:hypothetical protein
VFAFCSFVNLCAWRVNCSTALATPIVAGAPVFLAKSGRARYQVRAFSGRCRTQAAWSAAIAQLVEHVIRNDGVTGSSPVCGTSVFDLKQASIAEPAAQNRYVIFLT